MSQPPARSGLALDHPRWLQLTRLMPRLFLYIVMVSSKRSNQRFLLLHHLAYVPQLSRRRARRISFIEPHHSLHRVLRYIRIHRRRPRALSGHRCQRAPHLEPHLIQTRLLPLSCTCSDHLASHAIPYSSRRNNILRGYLGVHHTTRASVTQSTPLSVAQPRQP